MKTLSRNEMKKIMGGCTPGATIVGTSGGGVPGGCKVDVMLCTQSCVCETKCDQPQSDEMCPSS
jgi:bacteriocin-like protein